MSIQDEKVTINDIKWVGYKPAYRRNRIDYLAVFEQFVHAKAIYLLWKRILENRELWDFEVEEYKKDKERYESLQGIILEYEKDWINAFNVDKDGWHPLDFFGPYVQTTKDFMDDNFDKLLTDDEE